MLGWGQILRKWYSHSVNADRQLDVSSDYIGYYTDNGNITVNGVWFIFYIAIFAVDILVMICVSLLPF